MTKSAALKKAIKLWGKNGAIQDRGVPSSPEARAAARAAYDTIPKEFPEPYPTDDQTIRELKAWQARKNTFIKNRREVGYGIGVYRYCVGVASVLFFEVKGEGDSWEEAFAKAEEHQSARVTK